MAQAEIQAQAPTPPPAPTATHVTWEDGATVIENDSAHLEIQNKFWAVFFAEFPDGDTSLGPPDGSTTPPDPGEARGSFRIRKAETTFEGWFWRKEIQYELELTYREPGGVLNHAVVDWDTLGNGALRFTFGQFKAGFGRQELISSSRQQFVNRTFVSDLFSPAENQGAQVHGRLLDHKLEYTLGMFNGNGRNASGRNGDLNDNDEFQYDARLQLEPWGEIGYSESDFESTDHPLVAFAVEAQHDDRRQAAVDGGAKLFTLGGDVSLKWRGLSFFSQAFLRDGSAAGSFGTLAVAAQVGWFVCGRTLEVALRQATLDPDRDADDDRQHETGAAFNWYIRGRKFKVQTDLRRLQDQALDAVVWEWRLQTYASF